MTALKRNGMLKADIDTAINKAKEHIDGGGHVRMVPDCPICSPEYAKSLTLARKRELSK